MQVAPAPVAPTYPVNGRGFPSRRTPVVVEDALVVPAKNLNDTCVGREAGDEPRHATRPAEEEPQLRTRADIKGRLFEKVLVVDGKG